MNVGDLVNYHLNAKANDCPEAEHGTAAFARVTRVRTDAEGAETLYDVAVEGRDLMRVQLRAGDTAGCVAPLPPPAPADLAPAEEQVAPPAPKTTTEPAA